MLRTVLSHVFAPAFFLGFVGLATARVAAGDGVHVLVGLLVLAVGVSFAVERWIPAQPSFNRARYDVGRDVAHAVVNELANFASVLSLPLAALLLPRLDVWPSGWPLVAQLALAILIADLGITLGHFASHRSEWLWRFHAVHHSVERMYGFNGLMKHPLHQAFELLCGTTPLVLMGLPFEVALLLAFAVAIQLLLQHSNADLRIGPLRRFWALAPVHRFHHLNRSPDGDVNFGLFTALWDHLLGTYYFDPARRFDVGDLGVEGRPDYPVSYGRQLLAPFRSG